MNKVESNTELCWRDSVLETEEEYIKFFEDICTIKEFSTLEEVADTAHRWQVFNEKYNKLTGASSLITINKYLMYGEVGTKTVLDKNNNFEENGDTEEQ